MPDTIGQYTILESVGSGGMATVYKAHQTKLDRNVAIKVMHELFAEDPEFLRRFEREARIVARLDHPNIVPVYDYDDYEGRPYLVMKFIEGITLKDLLRNQTLSSQEGLAILVPVANALNYAHRQGVLHRDVKPSNVIIDQNTTPYLTDFGLARVVQAGESTMSIDTMLGTPHYISPEQAQGQTDLDARTDVYSLAVVLYELTTGQVPFSGESSYAIVHSHIYMPPPPPSDVNPEVSREVEMVILRGLSKLPDDRYDTPVDLINAYKAALAGATLPAPDRSQIAPPQVVQVPRPPAPSQPPQASQSRRESRREARRAKRSERRASQHGGPPAERKEKKQNSWMDEIDQETRESLAEAWQEIKGGLREAGDEIKKSLNWEEGKTWREAPDGSKGFYSDSEIRQIEQKLTPEERARRRVEARMEERSGLVGHFISYLFVNLMMWGIFFANGASGHPWPMWITFGWGIGMASHFASYYSEHGPGRLAREREIQRELERELARERGYDASKAKNDQYYSPDAPVRLTEDGELTESFVDEMDDYGQDKRKNR